MPVLPFLVGGAFGATTHILSNSIRRVPVMSQPWHGLMAAAVGSVAAWQIDSYADAAQERVQLFHARVADLDKVRASTLSASNPSGSSSDSSSDE